MDATFPSPSYADIETSSDEYAVRFSGEAGKWLLERQNSIIKRIIFSNKVETILDVGGGHGQIASALAGNGYQMTIMGSTDACSKQISHFCANGTCKFEVGDIEKLPYPDNSFDVVTCVRYLSHTDNWRDVISELCRVAKKGVIVDYPKLISANLLTPIFFTAKKYFEKNTRPYKIFTEHSIREAFRKSGYKQSYLQTQFLFPMVLHRMLKSPEISNRIEMIPKFLGLTKIFGSPAIAYFVPTDTISN